MNDASINPQSPPETPSEQSSSSPPNDAQGAEGGHVYTAEVVSPDEAGDSSSDSETPPSASQIEEFTRLLAVLSSIIETLMPLAQNVVEARSKRLGAQPDLDALRERNLHDRILDHQRRSWEYYAARDRMAGWLLAGWTVCFVSIVGAGVVAIHKGVIDKQSAVSLGLIIAGAMGWAGSRVSGRGGPPGSPPPNAPPS